MRYKNLKELQQTREILSPPGDTLQSVLDQRSLSQTDLAKRMGRHKKTINEIVNGHAPITPETALDLERTLGIDAEFWLERERRYQLQLAELNEAEKLIRDKEWAKSFPLREMKQCGFIEYDRDLVSKTRSLLSFFGVSSKEAYESYYGDIRSQYLAFRMSENHNINPHALTAWLRRGEIQADQIDVADFDHKSLKKCLPDVKHIMARQEKDFFDELQELCSECGIRVVHTPKLPKAPVNGSTRWYRDKPLIQLSNRYKRNDIFWFTFFHEIGHIILHG
ncbi:MAG: HigA family addiction module antitoxin, partial [Candidatus Paceibacterota bacterium]